ncbi:MAG: glucan biosynthesis protein, partial [Marinobacter sp.]|nr:glucan biosynthesis protein [Marinobacter sp.]
MDRRTLIKGLGALVSAGALPLSPLAMGTGLQPVSGSSPRAFSYAWLKGRARALAAEAYVSHKDELPQSLKSISWDDYQAIAFRSDRALWRDDDTAFQIQL